MEYPCSPINFLDSKIKMLNNKIVQLEDKITLLNERLPDEPLTEIYHINDTNVDYRKEFLAFVMITNDPIIEQGFLYGKNLNDDELILENVGKQGILPNSGVVKKTTTDRYKTGIMSLLYGLTKKDGFANVRPYILYQIDDKNIIEYGKAVRYTY